MLFVIAVGRNVSVDEISRITAITADDVMHTLTTNNLIRYYKVGAWAHI